MSKDVLLKTVRRLIEEGRQVVSTKFDAGARNMTYVGGRPTGVELQAFAKWAAGCSNLIRLLGDAGEQWKDEFAGKQNSAGNTTRMLGTLEAIQEAIQEGLLIKVEDLVLADAFDNLLDQADYLSLRTTSGDCFVTYETFWPNTRIVLHDNTPNHQTLVRSGQSGRNQVDR